MACTKGLRPAPDQRSRELHGNNRKQRGERVTFFASDAGSSNKTALAWGVGAGYAFNKNIGVRVEYEDFGRAGDSNNGFTVATKTSNSKPSLWSAGLQYTF